jgi:hypothetical protein
LTDYQFDTMGSHITIVRSHAGGPHPITAAEVAAALQRLHSPYVLAPDARADARVYDPSRGGEADILFLQVGELWASNPSLQLLGTMIELARELEARVRNDDFKTYRTVFETYVHPDDAVQAAQVRAGRRRQAIGAAVPFGVGMLLGVAVLLLRRQG